MKTMTRAQARAEAKRLGVKYRIRDGEVHFYGLMPDDIFVGWYIEARAADESDHSDKSRKASND